MGLFNLFSGKEDLYHGCEAVTAKYARIERVMSNPRLSDEEKLNAVKAITEGTI